MAEASYYRGEWQKELALRQSLEGHVASLEDNLRAEKEATAAAYASVKPPVNISTGTRIVSGGAVALPNPALGTGLGVAAGVVGALGIGWLMWKRK